MTPVLSDQNIRLNNEGFLLDFSQWTEEAARQIAEQEQVGELTAKHWEVIRWLQEQHRNKIPLTIRKVGASGIVDIKEFYALFPGGPLKKAAKISGIPKPVSCI